MLFNSLQFIFLFLPIVLISYWVILKSPRPRVLLMNLSSFVFYAAWSLKFSPLLLFSIFFDYKVAQVIDRKEDRERKLYLTYSVLINLGLLGFFKYFYFFTNSGFWVLDLFQIQYLKPTFDIVLPVGISFYTFQSMSYTIDVYRRESKPYTDFSLFAAYVCFFPQLIAGPIVRHDELIGQIKESVRSRWNYDSALLGIHYFTIGLAKKVVVADRIAAGIDPALFQLQHLSSFEALLCALGYTLQLYFDFSGYSDMAIGLGLFFNLQFPFNFDSPYKSQSITEFWRRWHMTLSRWLRDYLYISLGGNRKGVYKTYRNLLLTMLLGGLWHGAGWTYVVWGAFHGMWLVIEKFIGGPLWRGPVFVRTVCTFVCVSFGWIFFRSPTMEFAIDWFEKIFAFQGGFSLEHFHPKIRDKFVVMFIFASILISCKNTQQLAVLKSMNIWRIQFYALLFFLSIIFMASESPFLYFQF